jgi:hypothetical protein
LKQCHGTDQVEPAGLRRLNITVLPNTPAADWFTSMGGGFALGHPMAELRDADTGEVISRDWVGFTSRPSDSPREIRAHFPNSPLGDHDITAWHPTLVRSEMHRLRDRIAHHLGIDAAMRCRASIMHGPHCIRPHRDPHTPWRVHVALGDCPRTRWWFHDRDGDRIQWHQPPGVWMIRTGDIQHSVTVAEQEQRWQLWYHVTQDDLGPAYPAPGR